MTSPKSTSDPVAAVTAVDDIGAARSGVGVGDETSVDLLEGAIFVVDDQNAPCVKIVDGYAA
jgi:hypothetical protein